MKRAIEVRRYTRRRILGRVVGSSLPALLLPSVEKGLKILPYGFALESGTIQVDADFPGGNIIVERVKGNEIYVSQDLRDTEGWWFYWYFRVRAQPGQGLEFHFTNKDVFTCRGPAVRVGKGPWFWLGRQAVHNTGFRFRMPDDADEARFCLAMPYLEEDLRRFLARHSANGSLQIKEHCVTPKGRRVERLHLGCLSSPPRHRVLVTCRHHACEMMASWVLEGLMQAVLVGPEREWFRENVELAILPFMDKDGVEDGDQGKNRRPHDHNRDYLGEPLYESVRALKEFAPRWSEGRLRVALDLHCPYIRGRRDEQIFLVGNPEREIQKEIDRFAEILQKKAQGPLPYKAQNNLPFGLEWNQETEPRMFSRWASQLDGVQMACTLEFPYACAGGQEVNPASSRAFGEQLASALRDYLASLS